ncbi:MAG: nucleoside hydrolase [Puniceicoccaceae bacterium]|nr:MAG: nucleoside hydrolase [Puniceicoccaceae bacterium]
MKSAIPVILDTDIGSDVDDTWALGHLLRCPELDLRLVTVGTGDTPYRARLTAKFLEAVGRADVPVGIGPHPEDPGTGHQHQLPWVKGYSLDDYAGTVREDGVEAMIDTILGSKETVTLIAIGPAVNIRLALEREPRIAERCRFVGMFGSVREGYAAGSPPEPETNVRLDVPAFRAVLAAPWQDLLLTPLDTCGRVVLDGEDYRRVRDSSDPLCRAIMENYRVWAPRVPWMKCNFVEERSSTLFDCVAVWLAYAEDWVEIETLRLASTDDGLTVEDPAGQPARVALRWQDLAAFKRDLAERLTGG